MTDPDEFLDSILDGQIFDPDGNPISFREWSEIREREFRRGEKDVSRVAWDEIDDVSVSTVWLGIDHGFGMGPPLIFETMVFGGELDGEQYRYTTREEAEQGHARTVELVRLVIAVRK